MLSFFLSIKIYYTAIIKWDAYAELTILSNEFYVIFLSKCVTYFAIVHIDTDVCLTNIYE